MQQLAKDGGLGLLSQEAVEAEVERQWQVFEDKRKQSEEEEQEQDDDEKKEVKVEPKRLHELKNIFFVGKKTFADCAEAIAGTHHLIVALLTNKSA